MSQLKKAIAFLFAEGENFSLEHRLLISAIILGILTAVIGSLLNLILSTSFTAVIVPIFLAGLLILLYYFLRIKRKIDNFLLPVIYMALIGIAIVWIFNGGIDGSNILPAFVILILALISVSDTRKKYIIILFLALNITIYFIQLLKPEWITSFPSQTDRWIDAIVTMLYSSFFIYLIIRYLHKHYTLERLKVENTGKQLMKLNVDKDLFISILAHDLKSPFNSLLCLSELLAKNSGNYDKDKLKTLAVSLNKSARNTYNLLEDLLMWANAQSGNFPFNPETIVFRETCLSTLEFLHPMISSKNISIQLYIPEDLTVFADQIMLNTILRNLLSNAVKFTSTGGRIVLSAEKDKNQVIVSVSDSGVGIPPEILENMFVLSRVHSTDGTENEKGTGLGLFICKQFVERHKGKIWVESIPGQGSIFSFTL